MGFLPQKLFRIKTCILDMANIHIYHVKSKHKLNLFFLIFVFSGERNKAYIPE